MKKYYLLALFAFFGAVCSYASQAYQFTDLQLTRTDATHATAGATCTASSPCVVRFNETAMRVTSSATVTLSGTTTGVLYAWLDHTGAYNIGYPTGTTVACSSCTARLSTSFPAASLPLGTISYTNGAFDSPGVTDFRAFLSRNAITGGSGLIVTAVGTTNTIAADPTVLALYVGPPATAAAPCSVNNWSYDLSYYYVCVAPNTWRRVAITSW
jgi:hypothetical protein